MRVRRLFVAPGLLLFFLHSTAIAQQAPWHFAVSGDSRNCGDVVMPAIAKSVIANGAVFYWHLGDYRAIYRFDQDYWQLHKPTDPSAENITAYLAGAWQDFIENELLPFGNLPVYLAFGNHDVIPPKTHEQLVAQFADWLNAPPIREQRLKDNPQDYTVKGYYHWIQDGIDFITLDNAASDEFTAAQMTWLERVLSRARSDGSVRAVVVAMHEALPESISANHSMNQFPMGEETGRKVYEWLLDFKQRSGKPVYVLASHSHYYMPNIFDTEYWRTHGGILPGWIIGTAGAERYALPPAAPKAAKTKVYGYLWATVSSSKEDPIHFEFRELQESDVPEDVTRRFTSEFVHACWTGNSQVR